jgi:hypothetical protein
VADAILNKIPVLVEVDGVPPGLRTGVSLHDWRVYATSTDGDSVECRIKNIIELRRVEDRRETRSFLFRRLAGLYDESVANGRIKRQSTSPTFTSLPKELGIAIAAKLEDPKDRHNFASCNQLMLHLERLSRTCVRFDKASDVMDDRAIKSALSNALNEALNATSFASKAPLASYLIHSILRKSNKLVDFEKCSFKVLSWKHVKSLFQRSSKVSLIVNTVCMKQVHRDKAFQTVTTLILQQVDEPTSRPKSPVQSRSPNSFTTFPT